MHIKSFVEQQLKMQGIPQYKLAAQLNISAAMLSSYLRQGNNPSLETARIVYKMFGVTLYPFSEKAVQDAD